LEAQTEAPTQKLGVTYRPTRRMTHRPVNTLNLLEGGGSGQGKLVFHFACDLESRVEKTSVLATLRCTPGNYANTKRVGACCVIANQRRNDE